MNSPDRPEQKDLFGFAVASERPRNGSNQGSNGVHRRSQSTRAKTSRALPTLFDYRPVDQDAEETQPPVEAIEPPDLFPTRPEIPSPDAPFTSASGEKAKARDILAAIHTLKIIEQEKRAATPEERQALARFAGFGPVALSIFPDPVSGRYKDATWQAVGKELKSLLTVEEYESAKRTTFNAFYTSPTVIAAMHEAIGRLGLPRSATILEPGCGSGNFMSLTPQGMRFIGVELDLISGRIAKALHPDQDIRIENFRDTRLPENSVDGVIGNVPFADVKLDYHGQKLSLHDFFLARSIDALKPAGVLALVTSHFTLDKQNGAIREYLASKADFVGAIRLPAEAFKREGTAVVTDIIFMRKRSLDGPPSHADPEWLGVAPLAIEGVEVAINRYFLNHPEMVLGIWTRKDTLYGEGYSVTSNGDLAEQLKAAIQRLPEYAPLESGPVQEPAPAFRPPPPETHITEGSFFLNDDRIICQCIEGQAVPVVYGGTTLQAGGTMTGRRLAALIRLRDLARRVLQSQNDGWPETDRNDSRRELNWAYERFVGSYGPINKTTFAETAEGSVIRRMPNLVKFREDPDAMLVMSLEDYDEATGKAARAAIMQKDVVGKKPPITSVASAEEGLLVSLDQRGAVDLPFIVTLYMNQTIELRPHQKDAVWRGMSAGNTLLAQAVGAGKTFIMAATGMKMKQAGLIKKPMYVVPNHLLEQFGREFVQLYPNARLLIAGKEDLARQRRKHLTAKIASGEWDGIIVTHSSFERIGMSRAYQEEFLKQQIAEYEHLLCEGASRDTTRVQRNLIKTIEKQKAKREERLKDLLAEDKKDDGLVFDELAVDHIFIDEAQYYKNLETPTKMERVAGIQTGGSERAFDVFMKARYLHEQHPGHGVMFATGTPISNTMVEMYTMQRFLDPEGLRQRGLEHFDAWAATFGEVIDTMEISPDGKTLRPRSRFARFTNLPELQQMFRAFADVQTAEMLDLARPRLESGKAIVVACPMSEEQHALQQELVERYERLRSQKVDPREDNALNITTDGRKLAIDARMLCATAPDFPGSKVNALVENVAAIWNRTAATRGAQMIFCDMGVHPTPWGYSAYDTVITKLIAHGIPRNQIAAVGDADSDAKKQALFEKVRNGQVRVLLGSTQKMGTGTNVQKRLVALHHLDAPWKPAEVEQREGRILRQGNENDEVTICRYVTEGSFDAYMWQALETKARFIAQVITGDNALRRAEDIGGQELSYAEVKAIASGNPAVLTLAEADAELQRLTVLKKNHLDEQYVARRSVRDLPRTIADLSTRLQDLTTDQATAAAHASDPITIGGRTCLRDDAPAALFRHLEESMPRRVQERQRIPLGIYHGLRFGLVLSQHFGPDVYLEDAATRQSGSLRDHQGPRAILNAVEHLASGFDSECAHVRQDLTIAEGRLRDYQARLGKPFLHDAYLSELAELRDQLRAGLSGTNQDPDTGTRPSVAELAGRIKSLKAATTIEAAPERSGQRCASAEVPVTTRIRRRMEAVLASREATP